MPFIRWPAAVDHHSMDALDYLREYRQYLNGNLQTQTDARDNYMSSQSGYEQNVTDAQARVDDIDAAIAAYEADQGGSAGT